MMVATPKAYLGPCLGPDAATWDFSRVLETLDKKKAPDFRGFPGGRYWI